MTIEKLDPASRKILEDAVKRSAWDPAFFLRFFLSDWFPTALPPVHMGLLALLTRKVNFLNHYPECHEFIMKHFKYLADPQDPNSLELHVFQKNAEGGIFMVCGDNNNFIIPRGFSKTTLYNGANLYDCMTDGNTFSVYISETATHSETQLGNIRHELETNEKLRIAYGNVVPTRADSEKWTSDQLQLRNGAILVARGRGGQVRGLNFRGRRPTKIGMDDVEDQESIATALQRDKTEDWFYGAVKPTGVLMEGDKDQQPLQITNLGTLLGPDCLCMTLNGDPEFNTVRFGAVVEQPSDDNGNTPTMLWDYKMSFELYSKMRENARYVRKLSQFTREYDSLIRVDDDTIFPTTFIYTPTQRSDLIHVSQALDPAISAQPGRDHSALVTAGRRASDGCLWILDEWGGLGKTPTELIDQYFENHIKWQTTHNGIEAQQYQAALIHILGEEMARRQYYFIVTPIVQGSKVKKDDRIVGVLSPRYMNGYIRHLRPFRNLESNLDDWPNGKKDYADAAAMALTLLGESQGLVIPDAAKNPEDYGPLKTHLPPVYRTVSNHIVTGRQTAQAFKNRYG